MEKKEKKKGIIKIFRIPKGKEFTVEFCAKNLNPDEILGLCNRVINIISIKGMQFDAQNAMENPAIGFEDIDSGKKKVEYIG